MPRDDLLPLFLEEARDRLERLGTLLERVGEDPDAGVMARRELHALKGASRMLGLTELAEECHRGESLLDEPSPEAIAEALTLQDRLAGLVDATMHGEDTVAAAVRTPARPRSPQEKLRVSTDTLDRLTDRSARLRVLSVGAGGLVDRLFRLAQVAEHATDERQAERVLASLATTLRQTAVEVERGQRSVHRLAEALLESLLRLQVQPLSPLLKELARHARDLGRTLGKQVRVSIAGGETQLDRRVLQVVGEALVHLVRNAVDHGLESPDDRRRAAKPERGRLRIEAASEGDRVRIIVADDGPGIDSERVVAAAVARGMIDGEAAQRLSPEETLQLLFLPGFSTREEASEVSGRGVGLDAVAAAVRGIGGDVWIESGQSAGTTVTLEVPVARRGERVLVLQVGSGRVALPASAVRALRRIDRDDFEHDEGRYLLPGAGDPLIVRLLPELLSEPTPAHGSLIETVIGGVPIGIFTDAVMGEEEVLLHPLQSGIGAPELCDGMAMLAGGRPVAVLSLERLGAFEGARIRPVAAARRRSSRVLIVDDSAAIREMVRSLLSDAGLSVTEAATSEEALRHLEAGDFDCVVTDVEMPGMNGLELTRRLRREQRYVDLPVIVVSTRDRPEDRLAGLEAGADAYIAKRGLDAGELIELIQRMGRPT